jgi:hypothetical protein
MHASALVGRGFRLRDSGDMRGALKQARLGLTVLGKPYVRRANAAEASALVSLTLLAEEAASQLHEQGASTTDLMDSIAAIKLLSGSDQKDLQSALPFLEARLVMAASVSDA